MAGFRKIYTSQNEYLEDVAKTSQWFDDDYYAQMLEENKGHEYISIFASTKDNVSSRFDPAIYQELSGKDRYTYFVTENLLDVGSDEYKQSKDYITSVLDAKKRQETYDSLNVVEKTIYSVGGILGNMFLSLGGIVEGLIDVSALGAGAIGGVFGADTNWAKEFIAEDTTGVAAAQESLNEWLSTYTYVDKNAVWRGVNDVLTGIARMVPLIAGAALAPYTGGASVYIGNAIYFGSMAGNVAEEAVHANPDINYAALLGYTGAVTGFEFAIEKVSGKMFGDDVVSSLISGKKYSPKGSLVATLAKNFVSEGFEEATAEIFDVMVYNALVDDSVNSINLKDVLYAAIIGGITGSVMAGGQIATTKRKSVVNGELKYTKNLTQQEYAVAENLSKVQTWSLNNLMTNVKTVLDTPSAVTQLMSKYGTSLSEIKENHADEYKAAVKEDMAFQKNNAKMVLQLANLMRTIGVEQFKASAAYLNDQLELATEKANNYLNHTSELNTAASAEYSKLFKDQSFTPTEMTNAEKTLAKMLSEMYPNLKVAFGKKGHKAGNSTPAIESGNGWLFIESGLVEKKGFAEVLSHSIRDEIATNFQAELNKLPADQVDPLVKLVTDEDVAFSELTAEQKHAIAQIICFDPVANRKVFARNKKAHAGLFKYVTDQAKFVKKFARKTEGNRVRYADLLKIRNTFIDSIASSVHNAEDIENIKRLWELTDEETKNKIVDKTVETILNDTTKVSELDFEQESIEKRNAISDLNDHRLDKKAKFDYSRAYDESYYEPEWVEQIKSQYAIKDFKKAIKKHLDTTYDTSLEDRATFITQIKEKLNEKEIRQIAEIVLTKEFLSTTNDLQALQNAVADVLYTMTTSKSDNTADSIVVKNGKLKGTGKLGFINIQLFAKQPTDTNSQSTTQKSNLTANDISTLASKDYKTGEIRKSKAKGFEDVEYEAASVMDYEEHAYETLKKVKTLDDLKKVLSAIESGKIGSLEATFVLNLLESTILPTNFKNPQKYIAAKALIDPVLSARTTEDAQKMAARSELFGETNPVKSLSNELSEKFGVTVKPSDGVMSKWVEGFSFDRTNWLGRLENQYNELFDKRKNEKDPFLRNKYTLELNDLRNMIKAVAEGDSATILDLTVKKLQDSETNKIDAVEKEQNIYRDIVADFIQRIDVSKNKITYDPNKKYILKPEHAAKVADFLKKVNGFRYLALLSSPTTWGRNAVTNTLIAMNAIVEDGLSKNIENSKFLRQESQARYTGDYDKDFSNYIDEEYKARINKDTRGDKYHVKELDALRQEWAQENDPLKKNKLLYSIKKLEQKGLNDQPWTTRRVARNLKGMLAGSMNMISMNAYAEVKAMYKGDTKEEILANMKKTKSPLAEKFEQVYVKNKGNDMIGTLELAKMLPNTKNILDTIYAKALYRGNKLFFKTDNALNKKINELKKTHPAAAGMISLVVPFARTAWNTTMYIIDHSPIGILKGLAKSLQTRHMYYGDMRLAIYDHNKTEYIKQHKAADATFTFEEAAFDEWAAKNLPADVVSALNGDYKAIKSVFDQYVEAGYVNQSIVGSSDIFARAEAIESISQGLTGTAWLALGILLGALCDGFQMDEDDYLGPVIRMGDLRLKLDDLAPFSTMFSVGAIVNTKGSVLDKIEQFFNILIDASMLNIVESAIQYSDGVLDYLGNQSISTVQQFVPAIFKNITKLIDNGKKDKTGNYIQRLWLTTLSNLPLFSYLVADKIDPYTGESLKLYQSGFLEALMNQISPIGLRTQVMSDFEREARAVDAETTGLSGRFEVNDVSYEVKNEKEYAKFRADYIEKQFGLILSGKQTVTVEDDNGKRITTTYAKLTNKQKQNVINRLYTEATSMTKIKWWTDLGNKYVVTDQNLYNEYRKMFKNIVYKNTWNKSKFVES